MSKSFKDLPELSNRELDIIKILWKLGKASLREVHNELIKSVKIAYPTTKTFLDRMVEKGYVKRENHHGIFVYSADISKPSGLAAPVINFMEKILEIDSSSVASLFANSDMLTKDEVKELKMLIDQKKENTNGK